MRRLMKFLLFCILILPLNSCREELVVEPNVSTSPSLEQKPLDAFRHDFFFRHYKSNILSLRNFDEGTDVDSSVLISYNEIRDIIAFQDATENFIPQLSKGFGLPKWDSGVVTYDQHLWIIPFVYDSIQLTTALLFIKKEQHTFDFKLVSRDEVLQELRNPEPGPNLEFSLVWFMNYDQSLFSYSDSRFQAHIDSGLINEEITDRAVCNYTYCVTIGNPGGGNDVHYVVRGCPSGTVPVTVYYECDDLTSTTGWGLTGGGSAPGIYEDLGSSGWKRGGSSSPGDLNPKDWWEEVSYIRMILFDFEVDEFNELPIQVQTRLEQLHEWGEALELPVPLQVELWYECEGEADFENCVKDVILEHFETDQETVLELTDEDWPGHLYSRTCKESFNYVKTGNGYTAQITNVRHAYHANNHFVEYIIGVMCLQVRGKDAHGQQLSDKKAAELSAFAFDEARLGMLNEVGIGVMTELEAKEMFKSLFSNKLRELTGGQATSSFAFGPCQGNIPEQPYSVSPFGIFTCIRL